MSASLSIDEVVETSSTTTAVNHNITGTLALAGGALAVAVVGGGVGIVGAFGAIGLGTLEIFTGGAILTGIATHKAQKKLAAKAEPSAIPSLKPVESSELSHLTTQEIINLQRGDF